MADHISSGLMRMNRAYRLTMKIPNQKTFWTSHHTEEEVMWELASKLDKLGCLSKLDDGQFLTTYMWGEPHYKTYKVMCLIPYTEFVIKKVSPGSWIPDAVRDKLTQIKRRYDERV